MIAVATTTADLDRLGGALGAEGTIETVLTFGERRVVLVRPATANEAGPIAHRLRAAGWLAVARPDGGAAVEAWRRDTAPVVIADRLAVVAAWSEHDRPDVPHTVELAPGGFGHGHHPTTRLLLEFTVGAVGGGERVLDVGCGSGVLGLSALALGASELVAIDLKPTAVESTCAGAELNGFGDRVTSSTDGPAAFDGGFDIVFANVAREGIAALAPELVVATGGRLAVSGVTPAQTDLVAGLLAPLALAESRVEGNWAALVFERHE